MTNEAHSTRRALRSAIAVGATLAATVATAPLAFAQPANDSTNAVSDVSDLLDSTSDNAGADVELPANEPVNFAVSDVSENGLPILTFLNSALDLASQFLKVDTDTGAVNLLDELVGLLDGSGSTSGSFDAEELPDFLKQNKDGVISGDTSGVAPGKYTIKGTMTDEKGREQPIEFTMSVGGGGDDSGDSDNEGGSGEGDNSGDSGNSDDSGDTTSGNDSGDTAGDTTGDKGDKEEKSPADDLDSLLDGINDQRGSDSKSDSDNSSKSGEVSYEDTTITTGEKATVKPEGNTKGKVFVAVDSPDWAKVDPKTGAVELAPGNGTAAGENQITVGYTATSLQDLIRSKGAPSDLDKTDFIATVKRGDHKADAVAEEVNSTGKGQLNNAVNTDSKGESATQPGTDTSGADSTATQPGTSTGKDTAGTSTSGTSGERPSARQGTRPGYVDNAQAEQLPVTGINASALGGLAAVALLAGAGLVFFGMRRTA